MYLCSFNMKRLLHILLFILCISPAISQVQTRELYLLHYDYQRTWRFGMTLGLHVADFAVSNHTKFVNLPNYPDPVVLQAAVTRPGIGFNIDAIIDYKVVRNLHLRTGGGICFGSRVLSFYNAVSKELVHDMPFDSYYIEVPFLVKYSANRHSNFRPYVIGGANLRYNFGARLNESKGVYFGLNPLEPFYDFGIGFDFFYYYFKLSVELKYSGGIINAASKNVAERYEGYRDAISRMNSRLILLSFHFE